MIYFIIWLLFSIAVGMYAGSRGRGSGNWFVIAMLFSPLLGFIFCAVSPNLKEAQAAQAAKDALPSEKSHVKCPHCAEFVLPEASVCKHCGSQLTPDTGFKDRIAQQAKAHDADEQENLIIGFSIIVGIGIIIWIFN
jgi:hypothetical protein